MLLLWYTLPPLSFLVSHISIFSLLAFFICFGGHCITFCSVLNSNAPHFIYWLNACKKEKKTTKLNEIKQYTTWQTYTRAFCSQFTHSSFTVFYLHNSHVCAGEMNWKRNENERKTEKLSFHSTIMIENNCILFTLFVHLSKSRRYTLFARFPKDLYWLFVFFFSFFSTIYVRSY